jgi:hypothetical protein
MAVAVVLVALKRIMAVQRIQFPKGQEHTQWLLGLAVQVALVHQLAAAHPHLLAQVYQYPQQAVVGVEQLFLLTLAR